MYLFMWVHTLRRPGVHLVQYPLGECEQARVVPRRSARSTGRFVRQSRPVIRRWYHPRTASSADASRRATASLISTRCRWRASSASEGGSDRSGGCRRGRSFSTFGGKSHVRIDVLVGLTHGTMLASRTTRTCGGVFTRGVLVLLLVWYAIRRCGRDG